MAEIRTRVATPEYRNGWDAVFGKPSRSPGMKSAMRHAGGLATFVSEPVEHHPDDGKLAKAVRHVRLATRSTSR
jgi:hypothetical protein